MNSNSSSSSASKSIQLGGKIKLSDELIFRLLVTTFCSVITEEPVLTGGIVSKYCLLVPSILVPFRYPKNSL